MEKTMKVEKKNKQGKLIIKEVPSDLYSFYLNTGWKDSKTFVPIGKKEEKE